MSVIMYERHWGGSTTKTSPEGGQGGRGEGLVGERGSIFYPISLKFGMYM